jgi:isoleucyl-tRNA synthetase
MTTGKNPEESVHLALFPGFDQALIDKELEERMDIAQKISSLILGLRRKTGIKVRQPLARIMIPLPDKHFREKFEAVKNLVLAEVNVKEAEYIEDTSSIIVKRIKPNFKALGPKYGKMMKEIGSAIASLTRGEIASFEEAGSFTLTVNDQQVILLPDDVEIISEDIPGWQVANEGRLTVALDVTVTDELRYEGIAREFVNRIQNIRKENGYEVTDKISVQIEENEYIKEAVKRHASYIGAQTLAVSVEMIENIVKKEAREIEIDELMVKLLVNRIS